MQYTNPGVGPAKPMKRLSKQSKRDGALAYGKRGWPVVLLYTIHQGQCECGDPNCAVPGQHARLITSDDIVYATTEPEFIEAMWGWFPKGNIGIATGRKANLLVLVLRGPDTATIKMVERLCGGTLPETLSSCIGELLYLYFLHPDSAIESGEKHGIGVCSDSVMIPAPGSDHISGGKHRWLRPLEKPIPVPPALLDLISGRPEQLPKRPTQKRSRRRNIRDKAAAY